MPDRAPVRIQRRRTKGWRMPEGAVYVGRPTRWGNPFQVGKTYPEVRTARTPWTSSSSDPITALQARDAFQQHVIGRPLPRWASPEDVVGWFEPLRGRDLACWCPLVDENGNRVPCHADVLLELANGDEGDRLRDSDRADV